MENAEQIQNFMTDLVRQIDGEAITSLDFDHLRQTITKLGSLMDRLTETDGELKVLRRDFVRRIAGMEKAIAVAGRSRDNIRQALEEIEELDRLSAAQLVERYQKTQARFQDAFPTSFGLLKRRTRHVSRTELDHSQ